MEARQNVTWLILLGFGVFTVHTVSAQDQVPRLQDLVGTRGSSGERALQDRGYNWIRTEKSGGGSYSYWQESENGQCVVVRTADGRYASIVYAPPSDCQHRSRQGRQFRATGLARRLRANNQHSVHIHFESDHSSPALRLANFKVVSPQRVPVFPVDT